MLDPKLLSHIIVSGTLIATPEASQGIWRSIKGALNLFGDTNKAQGEFEPTQYLPSDPYKSTLDDEEIINLVEQWKKTYSVYFKVVDETQKLAFNYWVGLQAGDELTPGKATQATIVDNKIFEALETFLPIATRANPDPLVQCDPSDIGQVFSKSLKSALVWLADNLKLRRKLARILRHWAIYRLGAVKVSWDVNLKEIRTDVINSRRIIFDKDGYIDEGGKFIGEYIGEKKKTTAKLLTELFPDKKKEITEKVAGKMATKVEWYEWWYNYSDVFYTMENLVLGKFKDPNWNYDIKAQVAKDEVADENGNIVQPATPAIPEIVGKNHFKKREYPYVFLSIFSVGLHPHDETSLILQNVTLQDLVNRRLRQIDRNVQGMNNGLVLNAAFTEEQAAGAASALRRGEAIRLPTKDPVGNAVQRFPPNAIPGDVFKNLDDARNELRAIFGTSGSTPEAMENQDTVRGKILVSQQDSSRIGGGITEQLEQVADTIYNWWVQMMFVHYDDAHYVNVAGMDGGQQLFAIVNTDFQLLQSLDITVKEGSLIPKDPLTQRNEAIDLWSANAIDPLTFFKKLDYPDPATATQQLMLWQLYQKGAIPPQAYLPSFQIPQVAQAPMGQPPIPQGAPMGAGEIPPTPPPSAQPPEQVAAKQLIQSIPIK